MTPYPMFMTRYKKPGDKQSPRTPYLDGTCWPNMYSRLEKKANPFSLGKHSPGWSITAYLFLSRTNSSQSPLTNDLALGRQMNAYLLWARRTVTDGPRQHMQTHLQGFSVTVQNSSSFVHGRNSSSVIDGRCDCERPIRWRLSHVLLPPRMSNRGIWTRSLVCFGPGIFHVRSPGNPKEKRVLFPALHCPHCVPLPSLVKVKTKATQTPHC